ncbi:hypothetical protein D623_10014772 [Myotis brandtii]|uniref:Secreted protein n=1 Tax=Myotis brandtii TaxID=109478 RepID=S7MEC5_MYOBR|nr:hypothetical protein D623_10014772 [Myotis brandtii]
MPTCVCIRSELFLIAFCSRSLSLYAYHNPFDEQIQEDPSCCHTPVDMTESHTPTDMTKMQTSRDLPGAGHLQKREILEAGARRRRNLPLDLPPR